jgi:hypothetical protein
MIDNKDRLRPHTHYEPPKTAETVAAGIFGGTPAPTGLILGSAYLADQVLMVFITVIQVKNLIAARQVFAMGRGSRSRAKESRWSPPETRLVIAVGYGKC